jgi:hypothetical protein
MSFIRHRSGRDRNGIAQQAAADTGPIAAGDRRRRQARNVEVDVGDYRHRINPPDPRIERGLYHVHRELQHDEEQREHENGPLQQRQVALKDRRVEEEAGAGPGEHGLDQNRAAEQIAELQAHDGERRSPLTRSACTNSWSRISATSARTVREITPIGMTDIVTAGRLM